jgi:predicted dehydrogenase
MINDKPLRFGLVGLGGHAGVVLDQLLSMQAEQVIQVVGAYDPRAAEFPRRLEQLAKVGATVHPSYESVLESDVEAVWLPLPIDLHRPFTEQALAAGKAVLCEKPAAGCIDDVDAMIAARDRTRRPVAIGFQQGFNPSIRLAKRMLLAGQIGAVIDTCVIASWPRVNAYFARSSWAGAIKRGETWVLDSPANNALSHFIHLALYLLGPTEAESAVVEAVEAELYRVNHIQNYDTCALKIRLSAGGMTEAGATLRVYLTHADTETLEPEIRITGHRGEFAYEDLKRIEFRDLDGNHTALPTDLTPHRHVIRAFVDHVVSGGDQIVTLENARAHSLVISAVSQAAPVVALPAAVTRQEQLGGRDITVVPGLLNMMKEAARRGGLLHETGMAGWTHPARGMSTVGYKRFAGIASA